MRPRPEANGGQVQNLRLAGPTWWSRACDIAACASNLAAHHCSALWVLWFLGRTGTIDFASVSITTCKRTDIVVAVSMSSPDKSERSDAPIIEMAPKWAGGTYRHGSPDPVKGEQPRPRGI
jgi:hypothetical protein